MNDRPIPPISARGDVQNIHYGYPHRDPPRGSSAEVLQGRPAQMLLDRLDIATIVIGFDGVVVYGNRACERMLGYQSSRTLEGQLLTSLMLGQSDSMPRAGLEQLRDANIVTKWNHSDGYPLAVLASDPMLFFYTGLMLMVSLTDVSDREWAAVDRANRFVT